MSIIPDNRDKFNSADAVGNDRRWNNGPVRGRTHKAGQTRQPLRTVDDDHDLIGHDHSTGKTFPIDNENNYVSTSCRVGPVHAGGC